MKHRGAAPVRRRGALAHTGGSPMTFLERFV